MFLVKLILTLFTLVSWAHPQEKHVDNGQHCSFTIYKGNRHSQYVDESKANPHKGPDYPGNQTYFTYHLNSFNELSNYYDGQFIALLMDKDGQPPVKKPIIYLNGKNLTKDIEVGPLKYTEKASNLQVSPEVAGDFMVFAVPGGSIFQAFAGHTTKKSQVTIKVFSGKKLICENVIQLEGDEGHHH